MSIKALKTGLIGPNNIQKLSKLTKKPVNFFIKRARKIGKLLTGFHCGVWINSGKGMVNTLALTYKK